MHEYVLSIDQLEQYEEQGYIFLHNILSSEGIAEILDRVDGLLDGRYDTAGTNAGAASKQTPDDPGRLIKQVMPMEFPIRDAVLRKYSEHSILKSIASQLMGSQNAKMFQQQALIKEPGYPNGTAWHQDDHYRKLNVPGITAWFPLEPLLPDNSTMSVFPSTHKGEIIDHKPVDGGSLFHTLQKQLDESQAVPVLIPLGSVSFHHKKLIHGAFENQGSVRRVALAQHYVGVEE